MKRMITEIGGLVLVGVPAWVLVQGVSCQNHEDTALPPEMPGSGPPAEVYNAESSAGPVTNTGSLTFLTSVRVYIKLIIDKKYGFLAHLAGKRDREVHRTTESPAKGWWDNPLVVYEETPLTRDPDLTAGFDGDVMAGQGRSANAAVAITMIPHADIAVATLPKCDGMKGKITVRITAASDYYDGKWTKVVRVADKAMVFSFDTCDPSRRLQAIGSETRTVAGFAFERYTREEEKWEPRNAWPSEPESGDFWITIHGKDAEVNVTAYHYAE